MITKEQECYLFIADEKVIKYQGGWPSKLADHLCRVHNKVICISLYSNTIKFLRKAHLENFDGEYDGAENYKEVRFDKDYYEL